jgi:hypothetical protein
MITQDIRRTAGVLGGNKEQPCLKYSTTVNSSCGAPAPPKPLSPELTGFSQGQTFFLLCEILNREEAKNAKKFSVICALLQAWRLNFPIERSCFYVRKPAELIQVVAGDRRSIPF